MTRARWGLGSDMAAGVARARDAADAAVVMLPELPPAQKVELDPSLMTSGAFARELATPDGPRDEWRRADLFAMAGALGAVPSDVQLTRFLYAVHAWGYGPVGYGIARTRRIAGEPNFLASARRAWQILHDTDRELAAAEAYFVLLNRPGHVRGWGPAFFTKFLAFADPVNRPGAVRHRDPALILDRWMVLALQNVAPPARGVARRGTTPHYAYYLRTLTRIATDPAFAHWPGHGRPMDIERVLFSITRP